MKLALIGFMALLAACTQPRIEPMSAADAQKLVDSIIYVRAKNGLCFGVAQTSRFDTGGRLAFSYMLVNIDCARMP